MESCDENGLALCSLRNKFTAADEIEVVGPDTKPFSFVPENMRDLEGNELTEPRKPEMQFYVQLPKAVPPLSIIRKKVDLSAK